MIWIMGSCAVFMVLVDAMMLIASASKFTDACVSRRFEAEHVRMRAYADELRKSIGGNGR